MSNQIVISSGAKVRSLEGVLTGTAGIVNSVPLGGANGVATLDALGKVPLSQLPASVVTYLGTWNAATNTPTLTNGVGDVGDLYICNVAGTVNFGAGPITFAVGDWVIYSGTEWQKSSGASGTVTSVAVTESGDALTITGSPITTSGTINIGFAGTGSQYIKGDGTLATFPTTIDQAKRLITEVYNSTGATLSKGTVVYINGGQGNLPTVTKAQANADNTSAQTYGVVQSDITNMNNGFVVVIGSLTDIDTQAYAVGTQLYLSGTTAGAWTSTKPSAPIHLVYVGIVVRSHPTQGVVEIRIQNGYELEELHDVAISAPVNNQGIFYNSSNDLWENKSIATVLGYTPANDALVVHLAGTETISGLKNFDAAINLKVGSGAGGTGYIGLGSITNNTLVVYNTTSGTTYSQSLAFPTTSAQTYTFPAINGTVTLLEGTQTFTGDKTFSTAIKADSSILLKNGIQSILSGYVNIAGNTFGKGIDISYYDTAGTSPLTQVLNFSPTSSYTYTFPNASGTIALTSDLSSYVTLGTTQTITGAKTFTGSASFNSSLGNSPIFSYGAAFIKGNTPSATSASWSQIYSASGDNNIVIADDINTSKLQFQAASSFTYTFPATSGTIAVTSDLSAYLPLSGGTLTGALNGTSITLTNDIYLANNKFLYAKKFSGATAFSLIGITPSDKVLIDGSGMGVNFGGTIGNGTYTYTLPSATGTIALTSNLSSYLPLTGGTLTGALSGTSATFSGNLTIQKTSTAALITLLSGANYSYIYGDATNIGIASDQGSTGIKVLINRSAPDNVFTIASTGAATFSSNIAIGGATLSAWGSPFNVIQSHYGSYFGGTTSGGSVMGNNNYYDGSNYKYVNSDYALQYQQGSGDHFWRTAASGTAGATLSWNERMRITNAGNVGIGTSSPSAALQVNSANDTYWGQLTLRTTNTATAGVGGTIAFGGFHNGTLNASNWAAILGAKENSNANDNASYLSFGTQISGGSITERMRITSSGNVGIGTNSPFAIADVNLSINGTASSAMQLGVGNTRTGQFFASSTEVRIGSVTSVPLRFYTNDAEAMRITSVGNVRINSTADINSRGVLLQVSGPETAQLYGYGNGYGIGLFMCPNSAATGTHTAVAFRSPANGDVGSINTTSTTTTYNITSDYRLKQDFKTYNGLNLISEIKTYDFEWKEDNSRMYGVIAHELQEVIPYAVSGQKDGEEMQGVDYSKLVPILIKCIQELEAKIVTLESKIN